MPYEYDYDPKHEKDHPGWRPTDSGWARGSDDASATERREADGGRAIEFVALPPPGKPLQSRLRQIAASDLTEYFARGMAELEEASLEVDALVGDQRAANPYINHLIRSYADHKMPRVVHLLATYAARFFGKDNLSTDYRTRNVSELPEATPEKLESLGRVLSYEQAVIRAAGIANPDDTVTLFRNCGEDQLGQITTGGREYTGSNVESWTIAPELDWPGKKVIAVVPLRYCLASCIGRKDRPFMHPEQSEVVVCGGFIKRVRVVGDGKAIENEVRRKYLLALRHNMQTRIGDEEHTAARISRIALIVAKKELALLSRALLAGQARKDAICYGKRPIDCKGGNEVAKRNPIMEIPGAKKKESPEAAFRRFLRTSATLWEAEKKMTAWEKKHLPPPTANGQAARNAQIQKANEAVDDIVKRFLVESGSLMRTWRMTKEWMKRNAVFPPGTISTNNRFEDIDRMLQFRWLDFLKARKISPAGLPHGDFERLFAEFEAEELQRPYEDWAARFGYA